MLYRKLKLNLTFGISVVLTSTLLNGPTVNSLQGQETGRSLVQGSRVGNDQSTKSRQPTKDAASEDVIRRAGGIVYTYSRYQNGANNKGVMFYGSEFTDKDLTAIADAIRDVASLCLYGTSVTDRGIITLQGFQNLTELRITSRTKSGDLTKERSPLDGSGLKHLTQLQNLKSLDLTNTSVDDKAIEHITKFKNLRICFLEKTKISKNGITQLQRTLPNTSFTMRGWKPAATFNQMLKAKAQYDAWLARVKTVSREDILAFGFRDFKSSEFDDKGYIPNIPFGNDQKHLYAEQWYYIEDIPLQELLAFFGLVFDDVECPYNPPPMPVPNSQARVDRGRVYVEIPPGSTTLKKAWLHRWILKDQTKE